VPTDLSPPLVRPTAAPTTLVGLTDSGLAPASKHSARVVFRQTTRKALRSGALWGFIFAAYIASQAWAYTSSYKTVAERAKVASTFSSGGLSALVGPAHQIQTVAGYTVWKSLGILGVLGALWALMLSTKLLRGEEDAGRSELLLAGQVTRRQAAIQQLLGLATALMALFVVTAIGIETIGHTSRVHWAFTAGLFFAVAVVSAAAMFLAAGALTSQLAANRRQAAAYTGTTLGLFFALRMLSDAAPSLSWLRWVTPLGWVEQLQPFTHPEPLALLLVGTATLVMAVVAVYLADRRDLGASTLPDRSTAPARTSLLGGPVGLTVRLIRPTILGWLAGICAFALLLGAVSKQGAKSLQDSPGVNKVLTRLGGQGGEIKAYLGISMLIVALMVILMAAGQITSARQEEATGRLEHLLVRPISRIRWLAGRLGVAAVVVVLAGALAGVFVWLGVASQHQSMSFSSLLGAGLNIVPAAICLLGLGTLAWGLAPRLASAAVYGVLAWSFFVELLGGIVNSDHWLLDTSLFHQMTAAPATAPDWTSGLIMAALGLGCAVVGGYAFKSRDLAGE
jgi:ABC-2 type transport system permease protein